MLQLKVCEMRLESIHNELFLSLNKVSYYIKKIMAVYKLRNGKKHMSKYSRGKQKHVNVMWHLKTYKQQKKTVRENSATFSQEA